MVNSEAFTKRLKIILDYYSISASNFAEKLQIQRSSISHIISGRNKPSLDFVLKVVHSFPEVDLYWLLNGKGTFPKEHKKSTATTLFTNTENSEEKKSVVDNSLELSSNEIERIVVFYKNGTFKNYTP
ncbi:helix-turn-helix transcriptional regulator [Lutibacter sp. TH_r2]|uniref:helix-turn-helix transcriptional regulator n=1 Tax=Lutibacter sp. TH_r2 TaxID=3082083 RepID=UPI0029534A88|nr:helix-turn-helix transcriptional regulator [Lutibacter sp. TH_r2]MDV7188287.1 helix-turn-helix transcriptional regulator [Lutibacter sp. TH_r2]